METPVGLRTALVLSIAHLRQLEDTSHDLEHTSLIHKVEVIRNTIQHIASASTNVSGFYMLVIMLLFQAEVNGYDPFWTLELQDR